MYQITYKMEYKLNVKTISKSFVTNHGRISVTTNQNPKNSMKNAF